MPTVHYPTASVVLSAAWYVYGIGYFDWETIVASCAAGEKVLGGGFWHTDSEQVVITQSHPNDTGDAWVLRAVNDDFGATHEVVAYAVCTQGS